MANTKPSKIPHITIGHLCHCILKKSSKSKHYALCIRKTITQPNACFSSHYVMLQSDCMATTTPAVTTVHSDSVPETAVTTVHSDSVPETVTTGHWLQNTHSTDIYYLGANVEMATRHPLGNCTLSTWVLTRYTKTHSHCVGIKLAKMHGFVAGNKCH